jgi:hypothetical protein
VAKAPLSQTLILTEDGSTIQVTADRAVVIPPLVNATVDNTLASSALPAASVVGAPALFIALYARLTAITTRATALRARRLALAPRIAALES